MGGIVFYISLLILITGALMLIRLRFEVGYRRDGKDDHLSVKMTALKNLVRYTAEIPVIDLNSYLLKPRLKVESDIGLIKEKGMIIKVPLLKILRNLPDYIKQGIHYIKRYQSVVYTLLKSVRCHELRWTTKLGLKDAADTGIAIGLLWTVKGLLYKIFRSSIGKMENSPQISVVPSFNSSCFILDFHCIFDLRIGHIIIAGLKFVKLRLKL